MHTVRAWRVVEQGSRNSKWLPWLLLRLSCKVRNKTLSFVEHLWVIFHPTLHQASSCAQAERPSKASSGRNRPSFLCNCFKFGEPCSSGYHPSKLSYSPEERIQAKLGKVLQSASSNSDRKQDGGLLGTVWAWQLSSSRCSRSYDDTALCILFTLHIFTYIDQITQYKHKIRQTIIKLSANKHQTIIK